MRVGRGRERRRPVFVGDAEPGIGDVELLALFFFDLLVGDFLQALVAENADQALVQDVIALDVRRAVARDQRIRIKRDRGAAAVGHVVLDGEEIFVVDRDDAAERQPLAVVPGQRQRLRRRQRAGALLRPHGLGVRQLRRTGRGHPAEFGIERLRAAGRRQQHDRRRGRVDGGVIAVERNVVDARALERDRTAQRRRVDGDARGGGDGGGAGDRLLRRGRRGRSLAGDGGRRARNVRLRGLRRCRRLARLRLFLRLLLGLFLLLLFQLRNADKILPANQHERRQHDCDDGVLLVGHDQPVTCCSGPLVRCRPANPRRKAPSKSCASRVKGNVSAARRPIST